METMTLTDAARKSGLLVVTQGQNSASWSNSREVPYAELYRSRTGNMETPAENLQRAAEEEARRERHIDQ
jgi:hypothetical protein